jgi:hypothetical protein
VKAAKKKKPTRRRPTRAIPASRSAPTGGLANASTLDLLDRAIRSELQVLEDPGKKMTATQRGTLLQRALRMRLQLGELTGETLEIPMGKLVRMPAVRRLLDDMKRTLGPFPEAARAVAQELLRIAAGEERSEVA